MTASTLPDPGRCASCRHAQRLDSRRSRFLRCRRSDDDRRFARYPTLPVVACAGWERCEESGPAEPVGRLR